MSDPKNSNGLNVKKFMNKKNFMLTMSILAFIAAILYMQIGSSENTRYENAERPVGLQENPRSFDVPNQGNATSPGGFNVSSDFDALPRFDVPADIAAQLPESFGEGAYGGLPDITTPVDPDDFQDPGGNGGYEIPGDIVPPSWVDPTDDPTNNGTTGGPGGGPIPEQPIFNPKPGSTDTGNNVTLEERSDKARNLPEIKFVDLSFINFNFINISNLKVAVQVNSILFLSLLIMPIFIMNKIVPNFVRRLDDFDHNKSNLDTLFVMPKRNLAALRRKKERVRRLLIFKDHVDELIKRSQIRLERKTPSHTIIIGYHELDKAFSEFSSLIRTKDITPLEHSHKHFETGEIKNIILEKIVDLFYRTRFATVEISKRDGNKFIEHLDQLVIDKSQIADKLKSIEKEINKNLYDLD